MAGFGRNCSELLLRRRAVSREQNFSMRSGSSCLLDAASNLAARQLVGDVCECTERFDILVRGEDGFRRRVCETSSSLAQGVVGLHTLPLGGVRLATMTAQVFVKGFRREIVSPADVLQSFLARLGHRLDRRLRLPAGERRNVLSLAFDILVVFLIVGGSIWIMDHLTSNMTQPARARPSGGVPKQDGAGNQSHAGVFMVLAAACRADLDPAL